MVRHSECAVSKWKSENDCFSPYDVFQEPLRGATNWAAYWRVKLVSGQIHLLHMVM